ncbi:MAG: lipopolysaccharide assembly protein LapA domain-containing protein [Gemmobacter sp.]|uniref:lipopolysaccharide assembly protein LapA domain-containing protein n=1 Tax=Gemmobacter sp. TaxID=1898957 RepID=UPI00391975B1
MMKYLRYLLLAVLAICLVVVALANRDAVVVRLLPPDLEALTGLSWSAQLPLFAVIFLGLVAGLLIGFVWEWLREHKHRAAAAAHAREAERLAREVARAAPPPPKDDVLALLEPPRKAG